MLAPLVIGLSGCFAVPDFDNDNDGDGSGETATADTLDTVDPTNPEDPYDAARQACVDEINMYRETLGLPAYGRWRDAEPCTDEQAKQDSESGIPHGAFGLCDEFAQNLCPGWPSTADILDGCLLAMWNEGPGEDFNLHGHFINMSGEDYTEVACGFYETPGGDFWSIQDFR